MRNRILQRLEAKKRQTGGMANPIPQYQGGGQKLPGGNAQQIPGSDAIEFTGQSHDQGGIMVDNQTEVEDGETMDKVTMAKEGGQKKDYFFSSYLKQGGRSYAQQHKEILASGGAQEDIDYLAKMQEQAAGRDSGKVKAKLGGVSKYFMGGMDVVDKKGSSRKYPPNKNGEEMNEEEKKEYDIVREEYDNAPDNTSENSSGKRGNKYKVQSNKVYGDEEGEYGNIADYQPGVDQGGQQFYAGKDDARFRDALKDDEQRGAWAGNADPAVMKAAGVESIDDLNTPEAVTKYQNSWNELHKDNKIEVDGKFGEQTWRTATGEFNDPEETPTIAPPEETPPEETTTVETKKKKDYSGTLLGLGSMIPAVMAFTDKPDYMESPDLQAPGIVKAERVAKQHLDRVDFNDQIARNSSDAGAMNKFIDSSGGGPANMANKMALYANKQKGDKEIKAQEARANVAIANEEASADNRRKVSNANAAMDASKFNVGSQERASAANTRNKMYVDEFNRGADASTKDRKLNAVQYGINTLASLHRDKMMGKASQDFSDAVDGGRGALERFNNRSNTTTTTTTTPPEETAERGGYRKLKLTRKYGK